MKFPLHSHAQMQSPLSSEVSIELGFFSHIHIFLFVLVSLAEVFVVISRNEMFWLARKSFFVCVFML